MGFILAAVGSAVGLGNIWRFPWMTASNGGSAFLTVYLLVVLLVGVPGLLGEFVIGRRGRKNPVGSLRSLSGSRAWAAVGAFSVFTALALLSFYSVVGGWILRYFVESAIGLAGTGPVYLAAPGEHFADVAVGGDALAYHLGFLVVTATIVLAGVRRGIEVGTTVMMPAIVLLLIGLAVWASGQPNAAAGYEFYLTFDPSVILEAGPSVLGPAAGQALFTLSVGAGTMLTYASYIGEDRSLPFDATVIAVLNTAVGVLAGLVVFPLLFSQGIDPTTTGTGPGALFVGLVGAFANLPGGAFIATVFFGIVTLAALSSSISMLELPVSFLIDEFGLARNRAVALCTGLVAAAGAATALDQALFGFVAGTLVDILLTVGLIAFLLFVGWVLGADAISEFTTGAGDVAARLAPAWLVAAGAVLPLFLMFTLLTHLGVQSAMGFWPTAVVAVALSAGAFVALRRPASVV
jgi:NSS family neurotransmitter:Na+ symporter